jgi:hypothetical protein
MPVAQLINKCAHFRHKKLKMLVLHPSLDGMIIMPSHAGVPLGRAIFVCKITRYNFLRIRYSHCVPSLFDMCLIVECTWYALSGVRYVPS